MLVTAVESSPSPPVLDSDSDGRRERFEGSWLALELDADADAEAASEVILSALADVVNPAPPPPVPAPPCADPVSADERLLPAMLALLERTDAEMRSSRSQM